MLTAHSFRRNMLKSLVLVMLLATIFAALTLRPTQAAPRSAPIATDANLKIAFIGDTAYGTNFRSVLQLIEAEGAHAVIHPGDFDYVYDADGFFGVINEELGATYPYFVSVGNHDIDTWRTGCGDSDGCYAQFAIDRLTSLGITPDSWDLNDQMYSFNYRGLKLIFAGETTSQANSLYAPYMDAQLAADEHVWRICVWHKNMAAMQVGTKPDEASWSMYEVCRQRGAIIATAHEHSYSRTRTLTNMTNQTVDSAWPEANALRVAPGSTFAFVSGLGGHSIRSQSRCLPATFPYGCKGEWASIYSSSQSATYGALFITFNVDGDPNKAQGYFKAINGQVIDQFTVTSQVGSTETATPTNTPGPLGVGYYEENNSEISWTGAWVIDNNTNASGGQYRYTNDPNARINFSFTGTKLTLYRAVAFNRGQMQVCIDGACQTVQNYSGTVMWKQPISFTVAAGTHAVEIRNASTAYVDLDAIRVESGSVNTPTPTPSHTPTLTPSNTPTHTATFTPGGSLGEGYYEETNSALTWTGTWVIDNNVNASGGTYRFTNGATAKVTFSFTGSTLTLYRAVAFNRGPMQVCIDGACQTVQNYSGTVIWKQPVSFTVSAGTHAVEIRNASTSYIDLDAIRVEGSGGGPTNTPTPTATRTPTHTPGGALGIGYHEETNSGLTWTGTWVIDNNANASGGTYRFTNGTTAKVSFSFTGAKLTLYRAVAFNRGPMQVCIDGACQTVQNYSGTVMWKQPVSFTISAGTHTVEIRNASNAYIDLDALRIE